MQHYICCSIPYSNYTIIYHTTLYYTILYYPIQYYNIPYHTIPYYTIPYHTILFYTILYCPILYCPILYYTILYCPILHCMYRTALYLNSSNYTCTCKLRYFDNLNTADLKDLLLFRSRCLSNASTPHIMHFISSLSLFFSLLLFLNTHSSSLFSSPPIICSHLLSHHILSSLPLSSSSHFIFLTLTFSCILVLF